MPMWRFLDATGVGLMRGATLELSQTQNDFHLDDVPVDPGGTL